MRKVLFTLLSAGVLAAGETARVLPKLPLYFEEHAGTRLGFMARGAAYQAWLTDQEARIELPGTEVRVVPVNARPGRRVEGLLPAPGRTHYLLGDEPRAWRTDVPRWAQVGYRDLYPGVDLIFYGSDRQLECDFVVEPGANPAQIELQFLGVEQLEVNAAGDLALTTAAGDFALRKPVVYQHVNGARREVRSGYTVMAENRVRFTVSGYDASRTLFIDPVLAYSSYFGGAGDDAAQAVAVDSQGNIYLTGGTLSAKLPGPSGFQKTSAGPPDAFVTKMRPDGSVVFTTYLGGSGNDAGIGIAVDSKGEVYVAGSTRSTDFPTTTNSFQTRNAGKTDTFVAKLRADGGGLIYSTYLGGAENDLAEAVAIDSAGGTYVTGYTRSDNFPVSSAVQATRKPGTCGLPGLGEFPCSDIFVSKLNSAGTMIEYSTYLGSSHGAGDVDLEGEDGGYAIAVGKDGSAYVTGDCFGTDCPLTPDAVKPPDSAFPIPHAQVVKLDPKGGLAFASLIGGNNTSSGYSIALDAAGNAYVRGVTAATDFPVTAGVVQASLGGGTFDAFVLKLNASGTKLLYATYLGGSGSEDAGAGLAVDAAGNAYVSGTTTSADFPTTPDGIQAARAGGEDVFLAKLNPLGTKLLFSTYLGGADDEEAMALALDSHGNAYITGGTASLDFPVTPGALESSSGGGQDGFVAKISGWADDGPQPPVGQLSINHGGVVNAASSLPGSPVAPGSIAAVYGSFPLTSPSGASSVPWPTNLSGLAMQFGGMPIPLNYASANQLIIQVPWELDGHTEAPMIASMEGHTSEPEMASLARYAPGLFAVNGRGNGQGAILDGHGRLVDASHPIAPGEGIQIYCTGLGPVTHQPESGADAPSSPLAQTTATPTVTIGGMRAAVSFSGLAPGAVGLYQVNARVATGTPAGNAVPVFLSIGGVSSNQVTIAIEAAQPANPAPVAKSLSPSSAPSGSGSLKLTINGSGFIATSAVTFDGRALAALLVNSSQLTVTLSAADLASPGSFPVVVSNPAPGGGVSSPVVFVVTAPSSSLTGFWQGGWVSNMFTDTNGSISANLVANGSAISGTVAYTGSPCFTGGTVSGSLNGSVFSARLDVGGGQTVSLSGTLNAARNFISGSYTLKGGSCAPNGDSGSFSLSKTPGS